MQSPERDDPNSNRQNDLIFKKLKNSLNKTQNRPQNMDDAYFDRIFPDWARKHSQVHWTPACVAIRAAQFLNEKKPDARVLDIGSGVGKFSLIGASLSRARFEGIEQRAHLVAVGQKLVHRHKIPRVNFLCGDAFELDWSKYDAIYLYNPFEENRCQNQRIDSTIQLHYSRFSSSISATYQRLKEMGGGSLIITYHGFGGVLPQGFRQILKEYWVHGPLEVWTKL